MRVIGTYTFRIGNKLKLEELSAVVHAFLDKQGLTAGRFMYCLNDIDMEEHERKRKARIESMDPEDRERLLRFDPSFGQSTAGDRPRGCARAIKDCPKLGTIIKLSDHDGVFYDEVMVTNVLEDTGCTEADVAPFFKRFERTYGISDIAFFYYDVDFFGEALPFLRDWSRLNPMILELDRDRALAQQIYGSGVAVSRSGGFSVLELDVDLLHGRIMHDPSGYINCMSELLPGVKYRNEQRVFLSDEEKKGIERLGTQAEPVAAECKSYLGERLASKDEQTYVMANYNIAPVLKKHAKRAAYSYDYMGGSFFVLKKRLPRGHYLVIEVYTGPHHSYLRMDCRLKGLGFAHVLGGLTETPENQSELEKTLDSFFKVLAEFEERYSSKLDALYDETPSWFEPEN